MGEAFTPKARNIRDRAITPPFYAEFYYGRLSAHSCFALEDAGFSCPAEALSMTWDELRTRLANLRGVGFKTLEEISQWRSSVE